MVDSFRFLPRLIAEFYRMVGESIEPPAEIPFVPLAKPLSACTVGWVTSAGVYRKGHDAPFDLERERVEPTWGDPTYRVIPSDILQREVGVSHLHFNSAEIQTDLNVTLPFKHLDSLADAGVIGAAAPIGISVMGFQGYPPDTGVWENETGPAIANKFKDAGVDVVAFTPT